VPNSPSRSCQPIDSFPHLASGTAPPSPAVASRKDSSSEKEEVRFRRSGCARWDRPQCWDGRGFRTPERPFGRPNGPGSARKEAESTRAGVAPILIGDAGTSAKRNPRPGLWLVGCASQTHPTRFEAATARDLVTQGRSRAVARPPHIRSDIQAAAQPAVGEDIAHARTPEPARNGLPRTPR
jgi:hypothetical protein